MLNLVQMSHLADRKPHQLSGGQRQRVAGPLACKIAQLLLSMNRSVLRQEAA